MERDEDAYWRRRVIILAGGLVILGMLAWALSGSGGGKPSAASRQVAVAQVRAANKLPDAAFGSVPATPTASPSPSVSPSVSASAEASGSAARKARRARHSHSRAAGAGAACPSGGVVMTLFSQRPSYLPGERPAFSVYAVSTSTTNCVFRFGPGAVRVLVSRHGQVVWDSADCRPAPVSRVNLTRGVPAQMSVTWDRHAGYGCRGLLSGKAAGRFTAIATTGPQTTPPTYFQLVR
jgi:hypothetical protein